ncbi:MAG: 1-(5-phosphoribosyl)-5-[(5-phosphoribosylamino)methylideneamino] imidazole-4-carboxamide isomerase [Gammaproteobacteria bacterium]|nr:1-(5-phosphoribosyl)-5-[(5-phosphoribosylamino)methylideneamino] imidazole-4-carboxamide isomerase [Gammaproteobacteria bacterium]
MSDAFTVYPAIDVRAGRVVRLTKGDYTRETRYTQDPLTLAQRYAQAGATWLHLVDLDGARLGVYTLDALLAQIKSTTSLRVQTGGGVRIEADVERLLRTGADRVVVGSLAATQRDRVAQWVGRHGSNCMTIALDVRCGADGRWWPATDGWTTPGRQSLHKLVRFYSTVGLRHLLCTDIDRDGTLSGPNVALYRLLREWAPRMAVQASGGVRDTADCRELRASGCSGMILGKVLLEGRMTLTEALAPTRAITASC